MDTMIVYASVSLSGGLAAEIRPCPQINILWGEHAGEMQGALPAIFGGSHSMPASDTTIKAELLLPGGVSLFVSGEGLPDAHAVFVQGISADALPAEQVKAFHKQRFRRSADDTNLFDGTRLRRQEYMSESDAVLDGFCTFLAGLRDDRPLFLSNFLERLDDSVDLRPIFGALADAKRQVFLALPRAYEIRKLQVLEEMTYDTAIHTL